MNKIVIIGNLGRDPEMKYTPDGQAVTSFSVGSNRRWKTSSGESREETDWFNVSAWGKSAESCNTYLAKGSQVYVEGRLKVRMYSDRSGEQKISLDVSADQVQFLGSGRPGGGGADAEPEASGFDSPEVAAAAAGDHVEVG